jgi:cobalt-zinc-cadmium efflux system membrane fusion protein
MRYIYNLLIPLLLFSACTSRQKTNEAEATIQVEEKTVSLSPAQFKNAGIVVGGIEQRSISSIIKVSGKIDVPPQNMVSISMPLGGYLKTTKLLPGMPVKKGEVIATMEDLQYIQLQQEYLTTQSKLEYAENEYQRQKELNQSKASSDKVFQQTQNEYKTQKIMLSALAEKLKLINVNPQSLSEKTLSKAVSIYAPIDGFVSKVNVNIGKYVNPSDILFELINPSDIHLNLKVFEKDMALLSVGQKVSAFNNLSDKKYACEIILISQDLSVERSAEIHCHFEKYDKALLPGMYMNAEIETKRNNTFALPEEAVVNFEGKEYIFIAENKERYLLLPVQTGSTNNGFVEILNGTHLKGKQIVCKGAYALLMKMKNKAEQLNEQ